MSETSLPCEHDILAAMLRAMKPLFFRGEPSPLNDLPVSQVRCLHVIARSEGEKMLDLARKMEIKLPALSQIVDRLVKRGLLERQTTPNDRRIVQLVLTPQARELLAASHTATRERVQAAAKHLTETEIAAILAALTTLSVAAERAQAAERADASPPVQGGGSLEDMMAHKTGLDRGRPDLTWPSGGG